jgi:hypothetical protein
MERCRIYPSFQRHPVSRSMGERAAWGRRDGGGRVRRGACSRRPSTRRRLAEGWGGRVGRQAHDGEAAKKGGVERAASGSLTQVWTRARCGSAADVIAPTLPRTFCRTRDYCRLVASCLRVKVMRSHEFFRHSKTFLACANRAIMVIPTILRVALAPRKISALDVDGWLPRSQIDISIRARRSLEIEIGRAHDSTHFSWSSFRHQSQLETATAKSCSPICRSIALSFLALPCPFESSCH